MARQRLRLVQVRKPESFDDQKTPADILANGESGADQQVQFEYVLSQLRQILGTDDWKANVPVALADLAGSRTTIPANCLATDAVGDCVYVTGAQVSERIQVTKASYAAPTTVPVVGVIAGKTSATECDVQPQGELVGIYSGLTPGKTYFLGPDGRPALSVPTVAGSFVCRIGIALSNDVLYLNPQAVMTRRS